MRNILLLVNMFFIAIMFTSCASNLQQSQFVEINPSNLLCKNLPEIVDGDLNTSCSMDFDGTKSEIIIKLLPLSKVSLVEIFPLSKVSDKGIRY